MKKVYLIGAGKFGSRHLQGLKLLKLPLALTVIDPSSKALEMARERYKATSSSQVGHKIRYERQLPKLGRDDLDLAIIATTADARAEIIKKLLGSGGVKYFILEKLLFQKPRDYQTVRELLSQAKAKAWVNCSMRVMPFYQKIKRKLAGQKVYFRSIFGKYGLVTNAIHYLDYVTYLTGDDKFSLDTRGLDPYLVTSHRPRFPELSGTLRANFKNGSQVMVTSYDYYDDGPPHVEIRINTSKHRYKIYDLEGKGFVSSKEDHWQWKKVDTAIPLQSQMTAQVVQEILKKGNSNLPNYDEAAFTHLQLLEPLKLFLNKHLGKTFDYYPFT